MENKPYAIAVRIYDENGITKADIKTSPYDGSKMETIIWTKPDERERFYYNGYTLYYDERIKNTKPLQKLSFIVNLQHASGTDVLHDVVHGLLQVAVLADVLLHRIDGVHNGGMVTLEFGTDGFHAHTGDLADDIHRHLAGGTHIGAALFPADVGGNHIIGRATSLMIFSS